MHKLKYLRNSTDEVHAQETNSNVVDHSSFVTVVNNAQACLRQIEAEVEAFKRSSQNGKQHASFGNAGAPSHLSSQEKDHIASLIKERKQERVIPLDHILVVLRHMLQVKAEYMEMSNYVKEM